MANYAHIENNLITGVYDLLPDNWRNISNFHALASDEGYIYSLGWRTLIKESPDYDPNRQRLGNPVYRIENDNVIETLEVINLSFDSPPQPIPLTEEQLHQIQLNTHIDAMVQLRMKRDALLSATDYTQLSDVIQLNGEQLTALYVEYRQALRDLPVIYENDSTFLDVNTVVYPVKPEEV